MSIICKLFGHRLFYWHERDGVEWWTNLEVASLAPFEAVLRCARCKKFFC